MDNRAEEMDAKVVKVVETWRGSPEFDALAQNAYVVTLEEFIKYVRRERGVSST